MSEAFLGEIRLFSFNEVPNGWARCDGQILQIQSNVALYALLGAVYGGDGIRTFALPDLRGRVPIHVGSNISLGQKAGEETHTLTINEMPIHTHGMNGSSQNAITKIANGNVGGVSPKKGYSVNQPDTHMNIQALTRTGNSEPHQNMQPYCVANYYMAIVGIFPTKD